jgi:hypothetical protein
MERAFSPLIHLKSRFPGALPQADMVPRLYKKVNPGMCVNLLPTVLTVSRSQGKAGGLPKGELAAAPGQVSAKRQTGEGAASAGGALQAQIHHIPGRNHLLRLRAAKQLNGIGRT